MMLSTKSLPEIERCGVIKNHSEPSYGSKLDFSKGNTQWIKRSNKRPLAFRFFRFDSSFSPLVASSGISKAKQKTKVRITYGQVVRKSGLQI